MKLIKLPEGYIITSKISPFPNEKVFSIVTNTVTTFTDPRHFSDNTYFKIIASTFHPELPQIEFDLLSDEDAEEIGWEDVEKLAEISSELQEATYTVQHKITYQHGFIDGFQKAQSLSDKMFSLEDMKECWYEKMKSDDEKGKRFKWNSFEEYIESAQQKSKQWDIEIQMDKIPADRAPNGWDVFPKITDGKIKIIKILLC